MILVCNRFKVTPGREDDFVEAFKGREGLIDGMPGFLGLDVLRPLGDEGVFISMARWRSQADFEAWTRSDQFKQSHQGLRGGRHEGLFAAHPVLETFEVFETTWPEESA